MLIISDTMNIRLDSYLSNKIDNMSRSLISKLISNGNILVNNKKVKSSYKIQVNDEIIINYIEKDNEIKPINLPIDIIYEDEDYVFINKPKGLIVHPGDSTDDYTLVSILKYHYNNYLSDINGDNRLGIVHRLDKYTSGALCICKNNNAHMLFSNLIKEHKVIKKYIAIVDGTITKEYTINKPIGRNPKNRTKMAIIDDGKYAITHVKPINILGNKTLVECIIETGRTHQIRVHLKSIGYPVTGDTVYGKKSSICEGQALHAYSLEFIHPIKNKYMHIVAKPPEYFEKFYK